MNANHIALVTAITIIAATAAYSPANADELMTCRDASKGDATLKTCKVLAEIKPGVIASTDYVADASKPYDAPVLMQGAQISEASTPSTASPVAAAPTTAVDVSADMTPHKDLTGTDLMVWNKFCKGQDPKKVFEWRYNRCHGLSSEFVR